jgi:photosystem II stability/assembly factor-like uncharacterized protein
VFVGDTVGVTDIFGTASGDLWAVGQAGALLHFDGKTWRGRNPAIQDKSPSERRLSDLHGVWAAGGDVWAVGDAGSILRRERDGSEWRHLPSGTSEPLFGVWGTSDQDVWAVGANGLVIRCLDHLCKRVGDFPSKGPGALYAVAGLGPNDVWVAGSEGIAFHWDGKTWSQPDVPWGKLPNARIRRIVAGPNDLWVGAHRWDGRQWTTRVFPGVPGKPNELSVYPQSASDLWVFDRHTVFHVLGDKIVAKAELKHEYGAYCPAGRNQIWLLGGAGHLHGTDGKWIYHAEVGEPYAAGTDISDCATAEGTIWAVGKRGSVLRFTP